MSEPGPGRNGNGNGNGDSDVAAGDHDEHSDPDEVGITLDGEDLGTLMMQQLAALIDDWTKVVEALAEHGVDPTPVLQTLASTLRATADQLDPTAG
jgi:hypothetical protein